MGPWFFRIAGKALRCVALNGEASPKIRKTGKTRALLRPTGSEHQFN
jgi:hypothetical protein